jgi:hypothetical protein
MACISFLDWISGRFEFVPLLGQFVRFDAQNSGVLLEVPHETREKTGGEICRQETGNTAG